MKIKFVFEKPISSPEKNGFLLYLLTFRVDGAPDWHPGGQSGGDFQHLIVELARQDVHLGRPSEKSEVFSKKSSQTAPKSPKNLKNAQTFFTVYYIRITT